jgi:hypothetical protein
MSQAMILDLQPPLTFCVEYLFLPMTDATSLVCDGCQG